MRDKHTRWPWRLVGLLMRKDSLFGVHYWEHLAWILFVILAIAVGIGAILKTKG